MSVSRFALGDEIDLTREEPQHYRRGCDAEFDRLYDEFSLRVIGLVRRFIADEDLIDDIVQETFLRAYNGGLHREYLDDDQPYGQPHDQWPWLAAVARNLSLDHLRKQRLVQEEDLEEEMFDLEISPDDPESHHLAARRRAGIAEAFDAVCERQRNILVLKHIHGMAYGDIADRQGMSVEAVKSALARARATFRNAYSSIAERNGLGVVVGGVLARMNARVRVWRDRIASAPDATASALAASPAAANMVATLAVLGTVGVAGAVGAVGSVSPDAPEPTPIAASSTPVAEVASAVPEPVVVEVVEAPPVEPAVEIEPTPEPVVHTEPAPEPTPEADPGGTEAEAEVGTNDVVPVDHPPASGSGGASVEDSHDGKKEKDNIATDLDGDGEHNVSVGGTTEIYCPPPDERTTTKTVVCPIVMEEDDPAPWASTDH